jgi:hypothetical protein
VSEVTQIGQVPDDLAVPEIKNRLRCTKCHPEAHGNPAGLAAISWCRQDGAVTMPAKTRREVKLDHGRITVECPRLMTDDELADVLAAFVKEVRARPAKEHGKPEPATPSLLPARRKTTKRR